jgi:hypothetical protein
MAEREKERTEKRRKKEKGENSITNQCIYRNILSFSDPPRALTQAR